MRNKYAGTCFICNKAVPPGAGFFQLNKLASREHTGVKLIPTAGTWLTRCKDCVGTGNTPKQ